MNLKKEKISLNGWLNINKPKGVTSTQVVNALKRILNPKKIGHAGTLDPMAEGVLPIALGEATKTIEYIQDTKKKYQFTIIFGEKTDSYDATGKVIETTDFLPEINDLTQAIKFFTGSIEQVPPIYSAVKIAGKRAYELARKGEKFEIKSRLVYISSLIIIDYKLNDFDKLTSATLECECSKGTYIRSLAVDIAEKCKTLGYVSVLKRIYVGIFSLDNAISCKNDNEFLIFKELEVKRQITPIDVGLDDIPVLHLDRQLSIKFKNGVRLSINNQICENMSNKNLFINLHTSTLVRVYTEEKFIALACIENGLLIPKKVFVL